MRGLKSSPRSPRRLSRAGVCALWGPSAGLRRAVLAALLVSVGGPLCGAQPEGLQVSAETGTTLATPADRFAPGVLTTIPATVGRDDAIAVHDLVELRARDDLRWKPASNPVSRTLHEMAKDAAFVQDVWCLEFTFKPLRMIAVDIPQKSGRMQRKLIWYMVYRVRNTGVGVASEVKPDGTFETIPQGVASIRFIPQMVLSSKDRDAEGESVRKEYLDRLIPAAVGPIERREFSGRGLLNSVEMASQELKVEPGRSERGAWGLATWEGVDPETDFFSVEVGGLTNAYRWEDPRGAYQVGAAPGAGRKFQRRVLQLNFWRPGDQFGEDEREIRFGAAAGKGAYYEGGEGVAFRWVYR